MKDTAEDGGVGPDHKGPCSTVRTSRITFYKEMDSERAMGLGGGDM